MPHDQPYLSSQNKIEQALKSDATKLAIRHPFTRSLSVETKGGNHGA
jgi:hypothetical protein